MLIRKAPDLRFSDITPKSLYLRRREFLQTAAGAALGAAAAVVGSPLVGTGGCRTAARGDGSRRQARQRQEEPAQHDRRDAHVLRRHHQLQQFLRVRPYKEDPKAQAWRLKPRPWTITVEGFAAKKGTFGFDEFTKPYTLEERVYRMRCVEAWSMVIPWVGIPLKDIIATSSRRRRRSTSSSSPRSIPRRCRARRRGCCRGRTSKGCAWTRR